MILLVAGSVATEKKWLDSGIWPNLGKEPLLAEQVVDLQYYASTAEILAGTYPTGELCGNWLLLLLAGLFSRLQYRDLRMEL